MNKKPKMEQLFILLVLLMSCFMVIAMMSCSGITTETYGNDTLYTYGKKGCATAGITCGTIAGKPVWGCSKDTGCPTYDTGCVRGEDDKILTLFTLGCGGCFGCGISGTNCDDIKGGLSCMGCVIWQNIY
jgi:hypothetical protein